MEWCAFWQTNLPACSTSFGYHSTQIYFALLCSHVCVGSNLNRRKHLRDLFINSYRKLIYNCVFLIHISIYRISICRDCCRLAIEWVSAAISALKSNWDDRWRAESSTEIETKTKNQKRGRSTHGLEGNRVRRSTVYDKKKYKRNNRGKYEKQART